MLDHRKSLRYIRIHFVYFFGGVFRFCTSFSFVLLFFFFWKSIFFALHFKSNAKWFWIVASIWWFGMLTPSWYTSCVIHRMQMLLCSPSKPLITLMGRHTRTAFIYFAKVNKWKYQTVYFYCQWTSRPAKSQALILRARGNWNGGKTRLYDWL